MQSQLNSLTKTQRAIDQIHSFAYLVSHTERQQYLQLMFISRHEAMAQKLIMFLTHLLSFYIANHQIIFALCIFLPLQAVPIVLSRSCHFLLAFLGAYHLSQHKIALLSIETRQFQQLFTALNLMQSPAHIKAANNPNRLQLFGIAYLLATAALVGYCLLIEQPYHALTAGGLMLLACAALFVRNNRYCMSMIASISSVTSMLFALPRMLKLHERTLIYFLGDFFSKSIICLLYFL